MCHCLVRILDSIGPYFFENEAGQPTTVNGTRCGRVLSRFGDQNWPPRSCDLTLLDFFLIGLFEIKRSMLTIPQPHVHYKRKLNAASTKFSHNYAERS